MHFMAVGLATASQVSTILLLFDLAPFASPVFTLMLLSLEIRNGLRLVSFSKPKQTRLLPLLSGK